MHNIAISGDDHSPKTKHNNDTIVHYCSSIASEFILLHSVLYYQNCILKSNSHAQKIHACKYTPVCILYSGVQINLRVNLNCVRMGFIARSIFVGKFIISGLNPVHLTLFKFSVFAKQEEAASRCSCRLWQQRGIM